MGCAGTEILKSYIIKGPHHLIVNHYSITARIMILWPIRIYYSINFCVIYYLGKAIFVRPVQYSLSYAVVC